MFPSLTRLPYWAPGGEGVGATTFKGVGPLGVTLDSFLQDEKGRKRHASWRLRWSGSTRRKLFPQKSVLGTS
ncbi:hypothetical protein MPNT_130040 [Candidatus Methylacidithermus pantelleriae]|uniref:Uncharacterized protein n=1 Tax=Candidatus Methylacidithermus pantelleriae TaxID=2744239 RepID=A0A8J2FS27_9BACT|nr:hypothetical protein MPNT_130040 [Candidatus Methylacidithermus pantelleriae]